LEPTVDKDLIMKKRSFVEKASIEDKNYKDFIMKKGPFVDKEYIEDKHFRDLEKKPQEKKPQEKEESYEIKLKRLIEADLIREQESTVDKDIIEEKRPTWDNYEDLDLIEAKDIIVEKGPTRDQDIIVEDLMPKENKETAADIKSYRRKRGLRQLKKLRKKV